MSEVTIDNWVILGGAILGKITGHPNPNVGIGPVSRTSDILGKRMGKVVTYSGTEYTLGVQHTLQVQSAEEVLDELEEV